VIKVQGREQIAINTKNPNQPLEPAALAALCASCKARLSALVVFSFSGFDLGFRTFSSPSSCFSNT